MKKLAEFIFCLAFLLAPWHQPQAIDFKLRGNWVMSFGYGANSQFQGSYRGREPIGWGQGQDNFEPAQRVQLQLEAIVSENLSGTMQIQIGDTTWGQQATGGSLGADCELVELVAAYVDWAVPGYSLRMRMGIQNIVKPAMASGNSVFNDQVAGVAANLRLVDWLGATAFWARPYNDNYQGWESDGERHYQAAYLDNIDAFGLLFPGSMPGIDLIPWAMFALIGPNSARGAVDTAGFPFGNIANLGADDSNLRAGLFPAGGARHKDFTNANMASPLDNYAYAWWAAITGNIRCLQPFRFAFDFIYGSTRWPNNTRLNRSGWYSSLLIGYNADWGAFSLYGWHGSGDDANPANGSERLPALDPNNSNNYSHFAFGGAPWIERSAVISENMAGTQGVGACISGLSFIEDLSHLARVNFISGTNSPDMAKKMSLAGLWVNGYELEGNSLGPGAELGMPGIYLTSLDRAMELGSTSSYRLYENLLICMEASYIFLWLDTGDSAWGARHRTGGHIPGVKDAWNLNASFIYSF